MIQLSSMFMCMRGSICLWKPEVSLSVILQEPLILFLRQESLSVRYVWTYQFGFIKLYLTYIKLTSLEWIWFLDTIMFLNINKDKSNAAKCTSLCIPFQFHHYI